MVLRNMSRKITKILHLLKIFLKQQLFELTRIHVDRGSKIKKILEEGWEHYRIDIYPKDRRMNILEKEKVEGMGTENIRFLINEIVKRFAKNGTYLEVGILKGCSLLSAALFNPSCRCIGIDNFSLVEDSENILIANLKNLGNPKNIEYYNMDYKEAINYLFSKKPELKINVYYYDGPHSFEDHLQGLRMILPHLAENCVILVDDVNWTHIRKADKIFIKENPSFKSVFKIKTKANPSRDWWDGFQVITRGI